MDEKESNLLRGKNEEELVVRRPTAEQCGFLTPSSSWRNPLIATLLPASGIGEETVPAGPLGMCLAKCFGMNIEDLRNSLSSAGWLCEEARLKVEDLWQVTVSRGTRVLMAQARYRELAWGDIARALDYPQPLDEEKTPRAPDSS